MTDLAQILLLPPPTPPQRLPVRESSELAVNADAQGGEGARGRRFRFRVYEGRDGAETGTDYQAQRTGARAALAGAANATSDAAGSSADSGSAGSRGAGTRYAYNRNSGYAASSAFVAQSIAQEHLSEGLHNPPNAAAAAAYNRSGAALNPRASAGLDIRA